MFSPLLWLPTYSFTYSGLPLIYSHKILLDFKYFSLELHNRYLANPLL